MSRSPRSQVSSDGLRIAHDAICGCAWDNGRKGCADNVIDLLTLHQVVDAVLDLAYGQTPREVKVISPLGGSR